MTPTFKPSDLVETDYGEKQSRNNITCEFCQKSNLYWRKLNNHSYALYNDIGVPHTCPERIKAGFY